MKIFWYAVNFLFIAVMCSAAFEGKFRDFESKDGRIINARIVECNRKAKKIKIERKEGKTLWVPISIFSEKETAYLKECFAVSDFFSNETIMVKVKQNEKAGSSVHYEIFLHNRSSKTYSNIKLEYCIYIERVRSSGSSPNYVHNFKGSIDLNELRPNSRVTKKTTFAPLETKYTTVTKEYSDLDSFGDEHFYYEDKEKKDTEDKPAGVWFRISGPTLDGRAVYRDICYPSKLNEEFKWKKKGKRERR